MKGIEKEPRKKSDGGFLRENLSKREKVAKLEQEERAENMGTKRG